MSFKNVCKESFERVIANYFHKFSKHTLLAVSFCVISEFILGKAFLHFANYIKSICILMV